jgi:ElaB/YqjD/DUF883 family membrane-anchored ribosome-binding protein
MGQQGTDFPERPDLEGRAGSAYRPATEFGHEREPGGGDAASKTARYREQMTEQVQHAKEQASHRIESAAERLRERASAQGGLPGRAGEKAAEGMERTAGYLRERDAAGIAGDVKQYTRSHPMTALAGAAAAGYLLGRIFRWP